MRTNTTSKLWMLTLVMILSVAACKKKDGPDPEPQPVEVKAVTITELKALSTSASVKVPDGRKFKGIVISDASAKNIDSKTVVLQEATDRPGLVVNFDASQTFAIGDEVEVIASNQTLAQVNGEVVLQNVPTANAKKTGTGAVTARTTTIADITTNKAAWNGSLVTINATELSSTDSKYKGTLTLKDASGTINTVVLAGASFENINLPASVSKVTGIVRLNGNNVQINLRTTGDVVAGAITGIVTESFEEIKDLKGVAISPSNSMTIGEFETGFTTKVGKWAKIDQLDPVYLLKGDFYDAAFLNGNRNYLYMPYTYDQLVGSLFHIASNFENNKGLKSVDITFSGTTAAKIQFSNSPASNIVFITDQNLQIAVLPVLPGNKNLIGSSEWGTWPYIESGEDLSEAEYAILNKLVTVSPIYKTIGQWHTFQYTLPTKQELIDKGVSEANADKFIANPQIRILNQSSERRTPTPGKLSPIIFDKITFKYGN